VATETTNIYLADFDGDGKPDVFDPGLTYAAIIRNTSTPGNVSFGSETDYQVPYYGASGVIGDFDGDGTRPSCFEPIKFFDKCI
jgi:hypothetical protein